MVGSFVETVCADMLAAVEASELSPHVSNHTLDVRPGPFAQHLDVKLEVPGDSRHNVLITSELVPDFAQVTEHDHESGGTDKRMIVEPSAMEVRWNSMKNQTVQRALAVTDFYRTAAELANRLEQIMLGPTKLVLRWIDMPEPEQPTRSDYIADADQPEHHLPNTKTELQELCEELGLKKSGRKAEVRKRLVDYGNESGRPEVVETHRTWRNNQHKRASEVGNGQ